MIISRVPVILHTPLMSGSNFIHGIVLIGAMVVLGHADTTLERVIGFIAVLLGAGNAAGGYVVTERMLEMFKPSQKKDARQERRHGMSLACLDRGRKLLRRRDAVPARHQAHGLAGDRAQRHRWAGWGMVIATVATFLLPDLHNLALIVTALVIGTSSAWVSGKKVAITDMPQMVALYNGMGGGSAAAIGAVELLKFSSLAPAGAAVERVQGQVGDVTQPATSRWCWRVVGALIGAVSLTGSVIAWAKLDGAHGQALTPSRASSCSTARSQWPRWCWAASRSIRWACRVDHRFLRRRAGVGRADDAADRRRRHAGGDLACSTRLTGLAVAFEGYVLTTRR